MPEADILSKLLDLGAGGAMAAGLVYIGLRYLPVFVKLNEGIVALTSAVQALTQRVDAVEDGIAEVRRDLAVLGERVKP